MAERRLIALVASLALLAVAFVMLGPGRARPIQAARLYGGPLPEGASETSFRVVVVEESGGFRAKVAGARLRAMAEAAQAPWEGATGPDGTAEVRLAWEQAPTGPVVVRVTDEAGEVLAEGELPRRPEKWGEGKDFRADLPGKATGEVVVRAAAQRGVLAAPFADTIVVEARHGGLPAANARLTITAHGARLVGASGEDAASLAVKTDARGRASFEVAPLSHAPELRIEAVSGEAEGRLDATLPVLPGAMWLEPGDETATTRRILSPVVRQVAYLAIATPRTRLFGAAVPLAPDGKGQAEGVLDLEPLLPALRNEPGAVLTLASSEDFEGAGTVAWPLWADADPFGSVVRPIKDVLLLDGLPEARAKEGERRKRAAAWAGGALVVAAVAEVWLLYRAARRGRSSALDESDAELALVNPSRGGGLTLVVAIAVTLLALAAVGVVVLLRAAAAT